jgi:hypothetical protein
MAQLEVGKINNMALINQGKVALNMMECWNSGIMENWVGIWKWSDSY